MRALGLVLREIESAQRSYWRNRSAAFFTFGFPIVMLALFATALRDLPLDGVSYAQYYVPGIVAFGVISACYTYLAIRMCFLRDLGVLKRIRGTPLPVWIFMAGTIGSCVIISVVLVILTTAIGVVFYDVTLPRHMGALAITLTVGAFSFCALGFAVTVLVPYASAAAPTVNGILFPCLFLSGLFFPPPAASILERMARVLPTYHFHQAVFATFAPAAGARVIDTGALAIMLAWGVAGLAVAAWRFRWEPRQRP